MSIRPIVMLGDPRLRLPGQRMTRFDKELHRLLDDMIDTMRDAPGVGLAAQQVGLALQVCVVEVEGQVHELVNPRIVRSSGEQLDLEGCLSIPGYFADRMRAETVAVEARNRRGRRVRVTGSGLLARAIQHEYDHLQGELYVDRLPKDAELIHASRLREQSEPEDEPAPVGEGPGELAPVA